ncbi:MAG: hypothetical protein GY754_36675 [bacterium]|nr:hypothetical protein [bacterium]
MRKDRSDQLKDQLKENRSEKNKELLLYRFELSKDFIDQYPEYVPGLVEHANILLLLFRFDEAKTFLRKAIKLSDGEILDLIYMHMATLYETRGDLRKAIRWLKKIIKLKPNDSFGYTFSGIQYMKLGKLNTAEKYLQKAVTCYEGSVAEAYQQALEFIPGYYEAQRAIEDIQAVKKQKIWKKINLTTGQK